MRQAEDIAVIVGAGALCSIGLNLRQTASSVAAGISRKADSRFLDRNTMPVILGALPDEILPPLCAGVELSKLTAVERRCLRLAASALGELDQIGKKPRPVYCATPVGRDGRGLLSATFLAKLAQQAPGFIEIAESRLFPHGKAGFFFALQAAIQGPLAAGRPFVYVGGCDSYVDLGRLGEVEAAGRLHQEGCRDGFTPGEGVAWLVLSTTRSCAQHGIEPWARVAGVEVGREDGHRYSDQPYRGAGLASTCTRLFEGLSMKLPPVKDVWASFNGENLHAKEWGVSYIRNATHFCPDFRMNHPAEYAGDLGAALAPMMFAVASLEYHRGKTSSPTLIFASSDGAERGAALLSPV